VGGSSATDVAGIAPVQPLAEPVREIRTTTGALAPVSALSPLSSGVAVLLVDASRDELVVGLERLGDKAVCEVHDSDPFENFGARAFDHLRPDSSLR
jgi:hypothetical protein